MKNNKGFSVVYLMILITLVMSLGVIVLNKQTFFEKNLEYNIIQDELIKTVVSDGNTIISELKNVNQTGGIYKPFLSCPRDVSYYSGGVLKSITDTYFVNNICSGSLNNQTLNLSFSPNYENFSTGVLSASTFNVTGTNFLTGDINAQEFVYFEKPAFMDETYITPRIEKKGIIVKGSGYKNIFWNNDIFNSFINSNTNNTGSTFINISQVQSGVLYLDITESFSGKIYEFDKNKFNNEKKIYKINETSFSNSSTGSIGYLQDNLSISKLILTSKIFDFKNKDYAIFLSYNNGNSNTLRYKISIASLDGKKVYFIPIKDDTSKIEFKGGNIIISNGLFINKIYKLDSYK